MHGYYKCLMVQPGIFLPSSVTQHSCPFCCVHTSKGTGSCKGQALSQILPGHNPAPADSLDSQCFPSSWIIYCTETKVMGITKDGSLFTWNRTSILKRRQSDSNQCKDNELYNSSEFRLTAAYSRLQTLFVSALASNLPGKSMCLNLRIYGYCNLLK